MNKVFVKQIKEQLLEILDWCDNNNRKVALECVKEIADQALEDMNAWLRQQDQKEQDELRETEFSPLSTECAGSCENCECVDLGSETVKE